MPYIGPELHPSFDASSPPGCCPQSHEIVIKSGYEILTLSGLNCTRLEYIHSRKEGVHEKGQGKLSLAPNLLLN